MAKNIPDIVGNRYGRWTVIGNAGKCQSGEKKILCRCDCGTEKVLRRSSVTSGNSKSCGCYASEENQKRDFARVLPNKALSNLGRHHTKMLQQH